MQTAEEIREWFHRTNKVYPTYEQIQEELKIQELEDQGLTRSDAQAVVEAECR